MSTIKVTNLSGRGGASPNLPDGAVISGVATITNLKPTNVSVSGAVTATTFDGSLKSTGTPTLGLGVTINSSGVNVSGVVTATSFKGDGSSLTGVGESIAPWHYNPDVNDTAVLVATGIGITFNKKVVAGSGTATLKIVNAGAAGTTIQSWGVSSCTFNVTEFTLGSLVSNLTINQTYQVDIPSGFITDSNDTDYVGTAYTFTISPALKQLWVAGENQDGNLGQNNTTDYSSPTQIPGGNWTFANGTTNQGHTASAVALKDDGTLWTWGRNVYGEMGLNDRVRRSSPVQIPGTNWGTAVTANESSVMAIKTNGTMWGMGRNNSGQLGLNNKTVYSSPVQIPGTTWWANDTRHTLTGLLQGFNVIKSDGTMWAWGYNSTGSLGLNQASTYQSSPTQIPGSTWRSVGGNSKSVIATKTDGTLWTWGYNNDGALGHNNQTNYSSPKQVGAGTDWSKHVAIDNKSAFAIKTNGTLWAWGDNGDGLLGLSQSSPTHTSSPTQIPGTTWATISSTYNIAAATKTDGTAWAWGGNGSGGLMQNDTVSRSSPIQIGSETHFSDAIVIPTGIALMVTDNTP